MKVIIAGSRDFDDYDMLCDVLYAYEDMVTEVVCGMANGADLLGKGWAEKNNIMVSEFPAKWDEHGRSAGYIRNNEMVNHLLDDVDKNMVIVFWDGKSKGTLNTMKLAMKASLLLIVKRF